jgi:hypothetical protein
MSESSDGKKMSTAVDWSDRIADIAGPYRPFDTRESWLARAATKAGITFRQCKALFYGEAKRPKQQVADKIIGASERARREASDLASRFETLAGALNASDADFYGKDITALIHAARSLRGLDRT